MADVCEALRLAVHGKIGAGTYNLGLGQSMTVRDIAGLVQDAVEARTGKRPPLAAPDPPCRPPRAYTVAVDKLRNEGWKPTHSVADAIDETVEFCLRGRERA
jgi:nucleoside-diphosphate-sugar epimerase